MWLIYLTHYLRCVSWILNPADRNASPLSFSFWCLSSKESWSNAERPCRLDGGPVSLACLFRTFINRQEWNIIPGLMHSTSLTASKFCLRFSFSGSLSFSLHRCLWNSSSPPPVTGQAPCFHNCMFTMASSFPESYFRRNCSQTMRKRRIGLTSGATVTIKRVEGSTTNLSHFERNTDTRPIIVDKYLLTMFFWGQMHSNLSLWIFFEVGGGSLMTGFRRSLIFGYDKHIL